MDGPRRIITLFDIFKQCLNTVIRIGAAKLARLGGRECLEALVRAEVQLVVNELALLIYELECMTRVTVHMVIAIRCAPIAEQNENLAQDFEWCQKSERYDSPNDQAPKRSDLPDGLIRDSETDSPLFI